MVDRVATCIKCTSSYNLAQKKLQLDIVRDNMHGVHAMAV